MINTIQPRVVLACADEAVGRSLVRVLAAGGLTVAERALDAAGLHQIGRALSGATGGECHVVALVDARLPGLDRQGLAALQRSGVALVLLGPVAEPGLDGAAEVVPRDAEMAVLAEALRHAAVRGPGPARRARDEPGAQPPRRGWVVAVTSGHGGPGKTTLAINLAAALAERETVALMDLDLRGGNVAVALGLRPDYNLFQLASAVGAGHGIVEAVAAELQQVRPRLDVLGGLAAPSAMLAGVTPSLIEQVLRALAATHTWVVADLGSDFDGPAGDGHRAALDVADLVLAVAEPTALGLWNLRLALADGGPLATRRGKTGVVLNRFHPRYHHAPAEVAAVFPEVPVLACIPHEDTCAAAALQEQRLLVEDRHSEATEAIRRFAADLAAALPAGIGGAA